MWSSPSQLSAKALLVLSALGRLGALADPSINVALDAAFRPAPYLVELLETAAEENSTAYFPILDRVADGYFDDMLTEKELYEKFLELLESDGHIDDPATLASFKLALSVRSAAPRIQAHYQYYKTAVEPSLQADQPKYCRVWASMGGKQYCAPESDAEHWGNIKSERLDALPFDRVLGNSSALPTILYADFTMPRFRLFHKTMSKAAKEGKTSYRLRHVPSVWQVMKPYITVNGYGVELQLKRTDYIVIDDRQAETEKSEQKPIAAVLDSDEDVSDLKPLSKDDVLDLSLNAASFIMGSEQPMDTLLKLVQDFPKYTSTIAGRNASADFMTEYMSNREQFLTPGFNTIWINGVQIPARDVNPHALLAHMRRERKLINGVRGRGLSASDAISLLSHSSITEGQNGGEVQRYDFRDAIEGGNIIMWMNNMEKDSRYEGWSSELRTLLMRTFPGQLPSVRRDIHNAILPIDFTSTEHVSRVIETVLNLIKRGIPLQWGLVPQTTTSAATQQANIVYHLKDTYGLGAAIRYLEQSLQSKRLARPDKAIFDSTVANAKLRKERVALEFADVLASEDLSQRINGAQRYLVRLAATSHDAPTFINGIPVAQGDAWLSQLSQRVSSDLRIIQQAVYEGSIMDGGWVPQQFLLEASPKRNPLIIPENEKNIKLVNMAEFEERFGTVFKQMPRIEATDSADKKSWVHITLVGDFDSEAGRTLLQSVADYRQTKTNIEVVLIHNPLASAEESGLSSAILDAYFDDQKLTNDELLAVLASESTMAPTPKISTQLREAAGAIFEHLDLKPGQHAILINGRLVGPIPTKQIFSSEDVDTLVSYEASKRIQPLIQALEDLDLTAKVASPFDAAKLQSLVTLSTISEVPEGIFETASTLRTNSFKQWGAGHTAIVKGNCETAIFQIVASIDPATELAQKWVPILRTLGEMEGSCLQLFLNPQRRLQELPVKRFYRYLLNSEPTFDEEGTMESLKAHFSGIPSKALLNLGMDVPPSWLVAPEISVHDLDNIKLSSLPADTNIDAVYRLESILIEGHSRDTTNGGQPPRGAEIVLSTEKNPHFADTIIMANLGYFQFKANPGFYSINLKSGRSQDIFNLDSAGSQGWEAQPGDETNDIVLMSFQGTTLFPRLSRKPGQEETDVLAPEESLASELAGKGAEKVNRFFGKMGINLNSDKMFQKGAELLGGGKPDKKSTQADINIFSVASGHLYERMLNIMMLSVMKHTEHTVKFWFIEQFLSPSFKTFLPTMAKEYGFEYEMVTYKWPHWLRGQTEKQREIWGYKILFLDVLFPLDLDKVIFVDADQIVRTDMYELVTHNLQGAPYGFTPMGDSRVEMEGFRFWKTGYWANFLRGRPYHISALYVVDLARFRALAAGDRLRQQYHSLSADPASLSNLDQDLPNNMQFNLPIHSLPQDWLWCETWCADADLATAKTIDLCNNPETKEPKLDRARRQIPEWTEYDEEIAALARKSLGGAAVVGGDDAGSVQEEEQRVRDEL